MYAVYGSGKFGIPHPQAFEALGFRWECILTVDQATFDSIPTNRPRNGTLLRFWFTPTVYFIVEGAALAIPTQEAFNRFGLNPNDVRVVPAEIQSQMPTAPPDGTLLKEQSTGTIYLMQNGAKRPFSSPEAFDQTVGPNAWGRIIQVPDGTLGGIPTGATILMQRTLRLLSAVGGTASASPVGPTYPAGTGVTLTATANAGYAFSGWTVDGVAVGAGNPYTLTMNADHTVVATFAPVPPPGPPPGPPPSPPPSPPPAPGATLTIPSVAGGAVAASPAGPYTLGQRVTLTATPNPGQLFLGWQVAGTNVRAATVAPVDSWVNPLTITLTDTVAVTPVFAARPGYPDVAAANPASEAIVQLAARGIIRGYQDGRFGPDDRTLRAQMAALIARAMGWEGEDRRNPFPDQGVVDNDLWRNVGALNHYGVARGFQDGTYKPTGPVLHAQVVSFVTRAMVAKGYWTQATADDPAIYPNVPASSGHRLDLVTFVRNAGAVPGSPVAAAWADWNTPATRGWFARVLWQALDSHFGR